MVVRYVRVVDDAVVEVLNAPRADGSEWYVVSGAVAVGWKMKDFTFSPPIVSPPLTPPSVEDALAMSALTALRKSDTTLLRILETGKPVPKEWKDYRKDLRKIVSDKTGSLPVMPAYVDEV